MPYNVHYRVTALGITGTVAAPVEIWSWGFQIGYPGGPGDALPGPLDLETEGAIGAFILGVHTQSYVPVGSNHFLTGQKVAQIGPDGNYSAPVQEIVYATPTAGEGQGAAPLQSSLAVSLRGPLALPRVQGRFYIPLSNQVQNSPSTGKITGTGPASLSLTVVGLIETLNDALETFSPGLRVVVASSKGTNARVASVRVGDVIDTIRRRRNGLVETYSENLVPE